MTTTPIADSAPPVTPRRTRRYVERKPEQVARIVAAYTAGDGLDTVAQREGCSVTRVSSVLKRAGVAARPAGKPRTYTHDPTYFDAITDEARAYWLGFLLADGCVTNGNRLQLLLGVVDRAHVDAFREALRSTHPIVERATVGGYKPGAVIVHYSLRCSHLAAALARWGVTPRKSHTAVPPVLPPELARHFWRGMVDGDGYISTSGRLTTVGLTGNAVVCEAFRVWVVGVCETRASVTRNNSGRKFAVGGTTGPNTTVTTLLRALYAGSTVYLPRKHAKAAARLGIAPEAL